jgi:hypothetical protein
MDQFFVRLSNVAIFAFLRTENNVIVQGVIGNRISWKDKNNIASLNPDTPLPPHNNERLELAISSKDCLLLLPPSTFMINKWIVILKSPVSTTFTGV